MYNIKALKKVFNKNIHDIDRSKGKFFVLFITQTLFIIVLLMTFSFLALKLGNSIEQAMGPLKNVAEGDAQNLINNYSLIGDNIFMIKVSIIALIFGIYLVYSLLNGINWEIANMIANKDFKAKGYLTKFMVVSSLSLIIPVALATLGILVDLPIIFLVIGLITALVMLSMLYVIFPQIDKMALKLSLIKRYMFESFGIIKRNILSLTVSYMIIALPLVSCIALIYYLQDKNMMSLMLSLILFVTLINIGRIFIINVVNETLR